MKRFDLEAAKAGAPVVTRDGRKARIICFDKNGVYPVVALVITNGQEEVQTYTVNGILSFLREDSYDLFMVPQKKEYWVNVYRDKVSGGISFGAGHFSSDNDARSIGHSKTYLATVKIFEEEV